MKKKFFFFLILNTFYFLLSTISASAINPVIINDSKYGAPPADTPLSKDSNYYPNATGLVCKGTYSISQSFQPNENITTDSQGNQVVTYTPYTVDKIEGAPPLFNSGFWTNSSALNFYRHIGNPVKTLSGDPLATQNAFLSFNPDSPDGSFGAGNRAMPNSVLRCLKGQRLVKAVRLANGLEGGSYSNEQVAWDNGGHLDSVVDTTQDTGKKVQLDDIAIALSQNRYLSLTEVSDTGKCLVASEPTDIFYNPDDDCFATGPSAPAPGTLGKFAPSTSPTYQPISPEDACVLYKTLSPYDFGPSRRDVKTCSDDHGVEFACEIKQTNMPRGGGFATSPFLASLVKPAQQEVVEKDLCLTNPEQAIQDKPNAAAFSIKQALKEFGEIIDSAKTFAFPLRYEYDMDPAIQAGISADETAMKDLLPQKGIDDSCVSVPGQGYSSTDGKSFDPGNPCTRQELTNWLLPKNEQY